MSPRGLTAARAHWKYISFPRPCAEPEKDTIPGIYGYAESREVAMAAFAKSWRAAGVNG